MTLTASTVAHVLEWRVFIGPPFARSDAATFFDWSELDYGAVYEPTPAATALTDTLAAGGDRAYLLSSTGFPDGGGAWIGPVWEYVSYTEAVGGTLGNLVRETIDSEQTGAHPPGAEVRFWWPLTTATRLTFNGQLSEELSAGEWKATLAGDNAPQAALRNGHLVLVQTRHQVSGDVVWSDWTNFLVGWLQAPKIRQEVNGETPWEAEIVSAAGMLQAIQAQGLRVGLVNAAQGGSATGTQEVTAWHKASWTAEFSGSNVPLDPAQVVDGKEDTLYLSERYLGTENKPDADSPFQHEIYEVHIAPYVGQGRGYRWFQVIVDGMGVYRFFNQLGYAVQVDGISSNDVVVLCENAELFRLENPACDAPIIEISAETTIGLGLVSDNDLGSAGSYTVANWWDSLDPAAGALYYKGQSGGTERFHNGVLWGTIDPSAVEIAWGSYAFAWSGANIVAPTAGQTIRRVFSGDKDLATGYVVKYVSNPGTFIGDGHRFHLLVNISGMNLALTNTIAADNPGAAATLYLSLGDAASADGLDAAGTLQIGNEQITYSAKTTSNAGVVVTARGANGTTAAAHAAGEIVYQLDHGVATDALPLDSIILKRQTGKPVPKDFKIYASAGVQTPRVPDEDAPTAPATDVSWTQDYTLLDSVTSNSSESYLYTHPVSVPTNTRRYRWFLLVVTAMTTTPYQLALDEFEVAVADDVFSTATHLSSGTIYEAVATICSACGLPDAAIVDGTGTPTVTNYTTAPEPAWPVVTDLADMAGCYLDVGRDSKITVRVHPYFGGTPAVSQAWSKTLALAYAPDWAWGRGVSQVKIPWLALDGTAGSTATYPAVPDAFGDALTLDTQRFADAAAALVAAEKKYWLARLPFGAVVEAAGAPLAAQPGVAHSVTWQLDTAMLPLARTYLIDNVTHRLEDGALTTVVHGVQINREDER